RLFLPSHPRNRRRWCPCQFESRECFLRYSPTGLFLACSLAHIYSFQFAGLEPRQYGVFGYAVALAQVTDGKSATHGPGLPQQAMVGDVALSLLLAAGGDARAPSANGAIRAIGRAVNPPRSERAPAGREPHRDQECRYRFQKSSDRSSGILRFA